MNSFIDQRQENDALAEDTALWNLLGEASPQQTPSPTFVQDTLRRTRLRNSSVKGFRWQHLFSLPSLISVSAAACLVVGFLLSTGSHDEPSIAHDRQILQSPPAEVIQLEESLTTELLAAAADDELLLSEGEVLALLF